MERKILITDKRLRNRLDNKRRLLGNKKKYETNDIELLKLLKKENVSTKTKYLGLLFVFLPLLIIALVFVPDVLIALVFLYPILWYVGKGSLDGGHLEVGRVYAIIKEDSIEFPFAKRTIWFNEVDFFEFANFTKTRNDIKLRFVVHYKDKNKNTDSILYWEALDIKLDEFVQLLKRSGVTFRINNDERTEKFIVTRGLAEQYFNAFDIPQNEQERIIQLSAKRNNNWFNTFDL